MGNTPREDLIERLKDSEYRKAFGSEDAKIEIADLLYKARKQANLTQAGLSRKLNISQPYIAKLEAGEANPTIGLVGGILGLLGFKLTANLESLIPKSSVNSPVVSDTLNADTTSSVGISFEKSIFELASANSTNAAWYPSYSVREENIPECVNAGGI